MQHAQHAPTPIPPAFMDLASDYLESLGLADLPASVKYAFAQDVYPRYLEEGKQGLPTTSLWVPYNTMQKLARASMAFEILVGGRARSGKTDLLLGLALEDHNNSIIFRPEYSQMEALEERSRELLRDTGASYNASNISKRWRDIPGDRSLKFGAIKYDRDVGKYYGRPHDFVGFDEIAKFKEKHYLSVWAWLCSVNEEQRVRIVCAGNPPTSIEELWIKRRWAAWVDDTHPNPAKPGEPRWYVNLEGKDTEVEGPDDKVIDSEGNKLRPLSRTYIPGELLDFYGEDYRATLDALPIEIRAQLRDGDFNAMRDDQAKQVIPTEDVRRAMDRWESMEKPNVPLRASGVDVARGGDDQTIIAKRWGNYFGELIKYRGTETKTGEDVATYVMESMEPTEMRSLIVLDLAGVGSSPYDVLKRNKFNVEGFNAATASELTDASGLLNFKNRRAEAWWKFREALDPNSGEDIALPPDSELMADLTAPTWDLKDSIQIEAKDAIKKRIGRSPDCGDAVVMCFNADARAGGVLPMLSGSVEHNVKRY